MLESDDSDPKCDEVIALLMSGRSPATSWE